MISIIDKEVTGEQNSDSLALFYPGKWSTNITVRYP